MPETATGSGWNWCHLRSIALRETQRTLGPTPAADDAAQESVLRAWRHRAKCATTDHPESWLRTIARREALRALAAPSRRRSSRPTSPITPTPPKRAWTSPAP